MWNPAPSLSCSNRDIYVTDNSLSPLNIKDEFLGSSFFTDATNVHVEPSTVSRGVGDIGRHIEVRVEVSNDNSLTSTCAFQINIKGEYSIVPKFLDARKVLVINLKYKERGLFCRKDACGIANSEDPDQTASRGAVSPRSAPFAPNVTVQKFRNLTV